MSSSCQGPFFCHDWTSMNVMIAEWHKYKCVTRPLVTQLGKRWTLACRGAGVPESLQANFATCIKNSPDGKLPKNCSEVEAIRTCFEIR